MDRRTVSVWFVVRDRAVRRGASGRTVSGGHSWGTSDRVPPEAPAPTTSAEQAQAKIEATWNDPAHPYHRGDPAALDEMLALHRAAHPDPAPPETSPRAFSEQDLRALTVPPDLPAEDTRALQELVAHSGVDPAVVQAGIHRVDTLLAQPLGDDPEEWPTRLERDGEQAIAEARRRLGDRWDEVREHVHHAKLMLREVRPELYTRLLADPRTANDFELYMHLAAIGQRSREFFVSKYGTSRAARF